MKLDTIMVGLELTERDDVPLAQAEALAHRTGARLVLVHAVGVTEEGLYMHEVAVEEPWKRYLRKLIEDGRLALEKVADRVREHGLTVDARLATGFADDVLVDDARTCGADLLLLGTHGRKGVDRFLMGSVAERATRLAPCHVWVARGTTTPEPPRSILVPTDLSPTAELGLRLALRVAAPGAHVELFHAWQPQYLGGDAFAPDWKRDESRARFEERARALIEAQGREGIELRATEGNPAAAIVARLEQASFDLVVIGSHGYRGFKRAMLGSVAERVVRHAPISVLVAHGAAD